MIIIFGSLIFKDRKKKLRKKMINNNINDFMKIITLIMIEIKSKMKFSHSIKMSL